MTHWPTRLLYALCRLLMDILVVLLAPRYQSSGLSHVPHCGPAILVANHLSNIDSLLLLHAVRRRVHFMAMKEILETPVVGAAARFFGAFPIQRDSADRRGLNEATRLLHQGGLLVIYPEGRLSEDGQLGAIHPGAALLAMRSQVPLIPVGISGSPYLMPYGLVPPRPTLAPVCLHFGPPVEFGDLAVAPGKLAREEAKKRMEQAMQKAMQKAMQQARGRNTVQFGKQSGQEPGRTP